MLYFILFVVQYGMYVGLLHVELSDVPQQPIHISMIWKLVGDTLAWYISTRFKQKKL